MCVCVCMSVCVCVIFGPGCVIRFLVFVNLAIISRRSEMLRLF